MKGGKGLKLYKDAKRRGMDCAQEVSVLGQGGFWIWNFADEHFPGAYQIVALYHAREHCWNVGRACFGQDREKLHQWVESRHTDLEDGRVEDVIKAIGQIALLITTLVYQGFEVFFRLEEAGVGGFLTKGFEGFGV